MNNKSIIPVAMLIKKFYCHCCGGLLIKNKRTRTIRRGDPDYKEHSRIGRTHMIGDIELTEYDFKCPDCGNIIGYDEQCIVEKIQKQLGKNMLSEQEFSDHRDSIKDKMDRKSKIFKVLYTAVIGAIAALILYIQIKSGDFSFKFYF